MAKVTGKYVNLDSQSMQIVSTAVAVLPDPAGGLARGASGLLISSGGVTFAMLADAANIARLDQTESVAAVWDFGTNLPTLTANPTTDNQAARKAYVDLVAQGLRASDVAARAATTAALPSCTYNNGTAGVGATLTGTSNGALAAQDGVTLTVNQYLLVKNQSSALQNGLYKLTTVGSGGAAYVLTRHTSMDESADLPAKYVFVEEGTANADSGWLCTTDQGATIGTSLVEFVQFSGAGQITAGAGLTKTNNTLDVVATNASIVVAADSIRVGVDDSTIEVGGSGLLIKDLGVATGKIANSAVTYAKIQDVSAASKLLGRGSSGGSGVAQEITLGSGLSMSGTTISASASGSAGVETFTLDGTAITNKYVTLAQAPAAAGRVTLSVKSAGGQHYGDDFQMDGGTPTRLSWDGLSLDGILASGDKLTVRYDY